MADRRQDPEEIAVRVADGQPIDWDGALQSAPDDGERRVLRHLRLVEGVARVHRSGGSSWGHLALRRKLGEGAFGEVYGAWDARLEREVALKLLKAGEALGKTVIDEGRLLAKLRHPNVVAVYGAELHDGRVGIWMEFIRGRSLAQLLREQGPFGAREAALIGIDLCRALAAVHRVGVIHRDVKAENVMREEGGRILLTDFGAGIETGVTNVERDKVVSGTPLYMAPELFHGGPATARSDIYSLGVVLHRLVTGSFPVEAKSWGELRERHARREAKLLRDERPDLPEGFVRVVERATAWEPEGRFGSAGQMEQALALALGTEGDVPQASRSTVRRWPALVLVGSGLLAAAALVALLRAPVNPAPAAYTVEAALYRVGAQSGKRERLETGARLSLNDHLTLEFKATAPLHVYVINEDEAGLSYALFPLPGLEPQNPLPAGATHVLPGSRDGKSLSWTVSSPGGREHLMVLASPTRLVEFEAEMSALARPGEMAVSISDAARVHLRGIGGLAEAPAAAGGKSAGHLFEMAQDLASGSEVASGAWIRQIELENPPPD